MERTERGVVAVDVASIETIEFAKGVVVPNDEGVLVPLTAPLSFANGVALMRWRGESV